MTDFVEVGQDVLAFHHEFRSRLGERLPPQWRKLTHGTPADQLVPIRRAWGRRLYEHSWLDVTWPEAAGGRGFDLEHEVALIAGQLEVGAPEP
jgi:alkylation response protein AidB-like acyl-CoA dehydrogenase